MNNHTFGIVIRRIYESDKQLPRYKMGIKLIGAVGLLFLVLLVIFETLSYDRQ